MFIGGYAGADRLTHGITAAGFGASASVQTDVPNPFGFAVSGNVLYVASNVADGRVHALRIGAEGVLTPIGDQSARGAGTVQLSLHPLGAWLFAVNHDSGSVVVFPVAPDGSLGEVANLVQHTGSGPDPVAQQSPHPHFVVADPSGERVLVTDKGTDCLYVYDFDGETGALSEHARVRLGSGVGPRSLVVHPNGRHLYVNTELASTIVVCGYDIATGQPKILDTVSTLPAGVELWNAPSGLAIRPDGRFLYAANRGHDSIAVFAVSEDGGSLRPVHSQPVGAAATLPWDVVVAADGSRLYVPNLVAGTVATFGIDQDSGLLELVEPTLAVPTPACVALV
ncbi:6-phosphogluconolactonase [Kutzneria buriramensis]|uniref:6-phosphogluconolactonase n=2 Tax=Kutzneria buriramensis TaxID=1045776 RepID=A0A3E0HKP9_9PSEU|nr:6-phosphogluconolactonase [Kutzneria buriramensis]